MRVLLVSANVEKLPDPVVPLGLAYLSASLKGKGHEVHCLDLCFAEKVEETLKEAILSFHPQAIGFSLRNLDNVAFPNTVSYLPFYKELMAHCRQLTSAPILLGGSGFTLMPHAILQYLGADGGIVGEGEEAFMKALDTGFGQSSSGIEGVILPGAESSPNPAWIADLNSLPHPDWEAVNLEEYFRRGGMGNLQTKRGCPFTCLYCTYPFIEGTRVRLRSPAKVVQDAETVARAGIENVFIVDNIFNNPESHALGVCRALSESGIPLQWSCYAHPALFSQELAQAMKKAGCTGVEFGTDSGSPKVLTALRKNLQPEDIRRASLRAKEAGLEVCHSLSLGAPGETDETLQQTLDLMEEIAPTAVIAMVGLRIFPQTGLARLAVQEGLVPPAHDFLHPVFYVAPNLQEKIIELAKKIAAVRPNWIFPGLGINISPRLQAKLRRIGIRGPLWEHMKILRGRRDTKKEPHV